MADNELVVTARCRYMRTGEGLHRSVDPTDGRTYLYTQCAAADARRVFACFEQPDLKATFTWDVTAPAGWQVVSTSPTPLAAWRFGPSSRGGCSRRRPRCRPTSPPSAPGRSTPSARSTPARTARYPLGLFVRASMAEHLDAEEIFEITRAGLAHYERAFVVPFPFGKYDQVFVPEFNLGRDGEPRRGHVPRGCVPLPLPGHRRRP